ncbi:hypothetical protein VTN00DRAFT_7361 [Thermoascus crustaceus]|uniref:uncharacterized protein n=1 Tax=Thermoascus crustaceus TaxID=5088 RepID=UPI0037442838
MEAADLIPLLEQLEDHVDDLEEVLQPLLQQPLSATTKKLPVLDKAKLHVLITYTLESLLFSYLRLHGVDAKEHPVFKELTRVKQYFEKIKALETEPEKRTMSLDKQAAGRFIKHGLSGNSKYDLERAEREAKEKAVAQLKAAMLAKKTITATSDNAPAQESSLSGSGSDSGSDSDSDSSESDDEDESNAAQPAQPASPPKSEKKTTKERAGASKERRRLSKDERREAQKERRRKKYEVRKAMKVEKKRRNAATKATKD